MIETKDNLEVQGNRLLVRIWKDPKEKEAEVSSKILTVDGKNARKVANEDTKARSVMLIKCEVVKVGVRDNGDTMPFKPGDLVFAFATTFEGDITVSVGTTDEERLLIYSERNILLKIVD